MTALTFESISGSPRRSAARRNLRVALPVIEQAKARQPVATAVVQTVRSAGKPYKNIVPVAVIGVLALHVAFIAVLHRPMDVAPIKHKQSEMALELAPPPPPPPPPKIIQPKPLPQVVAAKPVARQPPPPSAPVVQSVAEDSTPSPDSVQVAQAVPPQPAPVAAAPAPEPEPVTEPKGYAGYLNNPAPTYPPAAQKRGLQGRVILKIHVLASGQPDNVSVAKSSGYDILDEAAVKAVTAWVFDPAKRGQTPIDGWVNVPINFKIS